MGVSRTTAAALRHHGHDVAHLLELGLERLDDTKILARAADEKRVVLTFDLDFGELLTAGRHVLPSVISFSLRNQTPASVTMRLLEILSRLSRELSEGAIVTVEDVGHRLRRLPIRPA